MFTLMWNLSTAIRGYLRFYMPTNILIDHLRRRGGWRSVFIALAAAIAYLYAMSLGATIVGRGGPAWLNIAVILLFWNAGKFMWAAMIAPLLICRCALVRRIENRRVRRFALSAGQWVRHHSSASSRSIAEEPREFT